MKLTENFNLEEFNCRDGSVVPDEFMDNVKELATNLQVLRNNIDMPVQINSGYRTKEYNEKIGGVADSQHLLAKAADIVTKKLTARQLSRIIEQLIDAGKMKQGGLGVYPGFVHYDIRGKRARW